MNEHSPGANRFFLMGIVFSVLGVIAIASPAVAGAAVVYVIGGMLLLAGAFQVFAAWRSEGWSHKIVPSIMGVLTILAGIAALAHPILGLIWLGLMLAIYFVVEGVWKIFASFSYRPAQGWLAILASGVIGLILGAVIWQQWPLSALWIVGTLAGIDLLSTGISFIVLAITMRKLKHAVQEAVAK